MLQVLTPTAPTSEENYFSFDLPPSYEEVIALKIPWNYSEAPPSYELKPTAPPAEIVDVSCYPCFVDEEVKKKSPVEKEKWIKINKHTVTGFLTQFEGGKYGKAPPPYEVEPTAPPAESDDETSSISSSCENLSDTDLENSTSILTKRQKRMKLGLKLTSYTVGLPLRILYEVTRTHDPYHKDNDNGHLCSLLAKKIDKFLS